MRRRIALSRYPVTALCVLLFLTSTTLVGCGGPADGPGVATEDVKVAGLVASVGDVASRPGQFEGIFVEGAAPQDREPYKSFMLTAESVNVDGDQATATVTVRDINGNVLGEVEWKFVKQGERWKIKAAPLPKSGS